MFAVVLFLINNYMLALTGHGFIVDADHMFLAILCEGVFEAPVMIWLSIKYGDKL